MLLGQARTAGRLRQSKAEAKRESVHSNFYKYKIRNDDNESTKEHSNNFTFHDTTNINSQNVKCNTETIHEIDTNSKKLQNQTQPTNQKQNAIQPHSKRGRNFTRPMCDSVRRPTNDIYIKSNHSFIYKSLCLLWISLTLRHAQKSNAKTQF